MNQLDVHSRQILACLGDASRFRLVHSLLEREQCVSELASSVGLSQSCTTRHLQYLEREGLVRGMRQGKRVMFRLRSDLPRVRELLAWVMATSHDVLRAQVSGAAVHREHPLPASDGRGKSGGARTRPAPPPRRRARAEPGPPATAGSHDGHDGAGRNHRRPPDGNQSATGELVERKERRPAPPRTPPAPGSGDMEDWLL